VRTLAELRKTQTEAAGKTVRIEVHRRQSTISLTVAE
jgi:hypothetical protein